MPTDLQERERLTVELWRLLVGLVVGGGRKGNERKGKKMMMMM